MQKLHTTDGLQQVVLSLDMEQYIETLSIMMVFKKETNTRNKHRDVK